MFISFYVSENYPGDGTWSVYSEFYESDEDGDPIDGSQRLVAGGFTNELDADETAMALYRTAPSFIIPEHPFT